CPLVLAAAFVCIVAGAATAQPEQKFSPLELAAGCAPPPTLGGAPGGVPHVIGSQDNSAKRPVGARGLRLRAARTKGGLELNQEFFVRRQSRFGMGTDEKHRGTTTVGWVRVVAVNESTAIAYVDQSCAGIIAGDYLEKFVAPELPPNADRDERVGEPDFTALGRVVIGNEDRLSVGIGDFTLIDRGSEQGLMPGTRFSVYP